MRNPWVWLALGFVLVLYVLSALRVDPMATFGSPGDDALYFASAKSLALGGGYVLPSFPVRLRATKYPELYPVLLANVRFLAGYRHAGRVDPALVTAVMDRAGDRVSIGEMECAWPGCAGEVRAAVLHLAWRGVFCADLSVPLSAATVLVRAA